MIAVAVAFFTLGFLFLIGVAAWAVVTIERMKRQQAVAVATLNAMSVMLGLQRGTDRIERGRVPGIGRDQ